MSDTVIKVENLSKKFCRSLKRSMIYGTFDITRSMLGISYRTDFLRKNEFWALKDINFELKRGETLGIIGMNGSGKSTLLRVLSGIYPPDEGKITIKGRVGALIALGAGFHPNLTGKENIFLNGTILGMTKNEIKEKYNNIIEFADIGEFIDAPVSSYSSGMRIRLGFAIAIHSDPDILLVDEVLAVGDIAFQKKCNQFLEDKLTNKEFSLILVTHSVYSTTRLCANSIILDNGQMKFTGDTHDAISEYCKIVEEREMVGYHSVEGSVRLGIGEIRVTKVEMKNNKGELIDFIYVNDNVEFNFEVEAIRDFDIMPTFYLKIHDKSGTVLVYSVISVDENNKIKKGKNNIKWKLISLNIAPGRYTFQIKIGGRGDVIQDILHEAKIFDIKGNDMYFKSTASNGLFYIENKLEILT